MHVGANREDILCILFLKNIKLRSCILLQFKADLSSNLARMN